ncbi:uncharacterized protein LOC125533090 [Triticum urartu]|uniref:uncharacterized protein LOC125533090 n=1 Tax=Triticum urartu TaxID=4572 RepID=UPI00204380C4|nr:uncharacterized protein LOC125533090 [Triticum urartu]
MARTTRFFSWARAHVFLRYRFFTMRAQMASSSAAARAAAILSEPPQVAALRCGRAEPPQVAALRRGRAGAAARRAPGEPPQVAALRHGRARAAASDKDILLKTLHGVRRYYAYRKGLLQLDFIKWNSNPEEVLKQIKESTRWSDELDDYELQLGLKGHMKLLKRHISELDTTSTSSSMPEVRLVLIFVLIIRVRHTSAAPWLLIWFFCPRFLSEGHARSFFSATQDVSTTLLHLA